MLQKLLVNNFGWIKDTSQFNEDSIKKYNEESDKCIFYDFQRYLLEVDVQHLKNLHELHNERMKTGKAEKPVTNLHDKTEYVINIRNLKQTLNQR